MTEEQLCAIEERAREEQIDDILGDQLDSANKDLLDLVAEVRRLRRIIVAADKGDPDAL